MSIQLAVSPQGRPLVRDVDEQPAQEIGPATEQRIRTAFDESPWQGLLHLATADLQTSLPSALAYARDLGRDYLTRLCHTPDLAGKSKVDAVPPPPAEVLAVLALQAPPMQGLEYLNGEALAHWWKELDALVRAEIAADPGGAQDYLQQKNPLWRLVGRVTLHLAENKQDRDHPFAFMATYASRLSAQAKIQHEPLGRALQQYAGTKNRAALLSLLAPLQRAASLSEFAKELVESSDVYQALAWSAADAYRFLQDVPLFEESGLIVRVPDWWNAKRPPRPQVSIVIGGKSKTALSAESLLQFSIGASVEGEPLSQEEMQSLLESSGGLVSLKGRWVEVDREKLQEALAHWKKVERSAGRGGLTFFEGMRLLSGVPLDGGAAAVMFEDASEWAGVRADESLEELLKELRSPHGDEETAPGLRAELRPYQKVGVGWLRFVVKIGLGACLADDMGLGKTIQVIALLLHRFQEQSAKKKGAPAAPPSLLVVPTSLIANWKSEIERFAPSLFVCVLHPSEAPVADGVAAAKTLEGRQLAITTYGMLTRTEWLRKRTWDLVILDEAQAIKNPGAQQTRAVKELQAAGRIALTGTPIENRLGDLWSLFDFLNPGLLGTAKAFQSFTRKLESQVDRSYAPLRNLVRPYILRRLKTDRSVITDLPEKTEVRAFCPLSKLQAVLYEQAVRDLAEKLEAADGIQRRGIVLAQLMRLKQICNHPSQLTGNGGYDPEQSGKFKRLAAICQELSERQERVLVFTQFREILDPLAGYLASVFGRPGLVLHGGASVAKRRELVDAFQRDGGPPFFLLSLKAGGTGLNLTAASHVVHFDRWWNPAVENQAADRAFRIGQKRNVLVHKFVCRGTVEEKIDNLIAEKTRLVADVLEGGGEVLLTEMNNEELMKLVALDVRKAVET